MGIIVLSGNNKLTGEKRPHPILQFIILFTKVFAEDHVKEATGKTSL